MIKLTFNTNIRTGIQMLLNDEVDPIIDFDGTRYLINITKWGEGLIIWSEFDIATQQVIGEYAYRYRFAAHNTFKDCIFGPSGRSGTQALPTDVFPSFPTPRDYGTVTP
jgi:hypothetical protein